MRAVQFLALALLVVALLLPFLRRGRLASRRPPLPADELVKDPVCQTYIVRSRAVSAPNVSPPPYFCSHECARRYAAGPRG